jgi:branched-chain amino acid transport system substrate-binding protein
VRRVYASLPLRGPAGRHGRDVALGIELALERANDPTVELVLLDSFADDRERQAVVNARRAAADDTALAYLGDFHSSQVARTAPVLGRAGLLQVAPVATFVGLEGDTLVRLSPNDRVGAEAVAAWLADAGVGELLVVHDHDRGYGVPVGAMCVEAARARGLTVRSRPVWDHGEDLREDFGGAGAVLYVGVAGSGAAGMWRDLHAANAAMWLLGTEGVATPGLARELSAAAAERSRFFVAQRGPLALYGFEAMSLILDSIAAGDGDRAAVVRAARAARDRDSVIGRYSIDDEGHTTSKAYGRLAVVDGELVWDLDARCLAADSAVRSSLPAVEEDE